jgi:hypothetical protein
MKKILFICCAFYWTLTMSCNPEIPVTWEEPGAQYRGFVANHPSQIGQTVVNCCEPGSNCATRSIREVQPFPTALRTSIQNDNIKSYFDTQDWEATIPELKAYPDIVTYIRTNNPKTKIVSDGEGGEGLVFYKDRSQSDLGGDNVLFALRFAPLLPCPGQQ